MSVQLDFNGGFIINLPFSDVISLDFIVSVYPDDNCCGVSVLGTYFGKSDKVSLKLLVINYDKTSLFTLLSLMTTASGIASGVSRPSASRPVT